MLQCVVCFAPLVRVAGLPSAATLKCTGCGMIYYNESWAEDETDEDAEEALKAYCQRLKARRHAAIDRALAHYKASQMPPHHTPVYREGVSCKAPGG